MRKQGNILKRGYFFLLRQLTVLTFRHGMCVGLNCQFYFIIVMSCFATSALMPVCNSVVCLFWINPTNRISWWHCSVLQETLRHLTGMYTVMHLWGSKFFVIKASHSERLASEVFSFDMDKQPDNQCHVLACIMCMLLIVGLVSQQPRFPIGEG